MAIIYANEDRDLMLRLKRAMESTGKKVWVDTTDRAEDKLARRSGGAIARAKSAVAILSNSFTASASCVQELALAYVLDKPLAAASKLPYEELKLDLRMRLTLATTAITYFSVDTDITRPGSDFMTQIDTALAWQPEAPPAHPSHRSAWSPVPVPSDLAEIPWWTSTYGHVADAAWVLFFQQMVRSLPVLNSLDPSDFEQTLARVMPPFGPRNPESVTREMCENIGITVDGFLKPVCESLMQVYLLQINAQAAFGPNSQVRKSAIDELLKVDNPQLWAGATNVLVGLAAAWDAELRISALNSLVKLYRKLLPGESSTLSKVNRSAVPKTVSTAVVALLQHGSGNVRTAAALAAGELRIQGAAEGLKHLLDTDVDVSVRDNAERALFLLALN